MTAAAVGVWIRTTPAGPQDLADVERRAQAAETRHQELSAKLPEATAPLLRQISALQDASSAQVCVWGGTRDSCGHVLYMCAVP